MNYLTKQINSQTKEIIFVIIAIILGITTHFMAVEILNSAAQTVSDLFLKFLQLLSTPIIFLAIVTNFLSLSDQKHLKFYGKRVVIYTILTTIAAATVAYVLFQAISPAASFINNSIHSHVNSNSSYLNHLKNIFPSNIVSAFAENNVLGVALIAAIMGIAMTRLPRNQQDHLQPVFSGLFHTFINIAGFIITVLPIGIWAFTVLFCQAIASQQISLDILRKYLLVILSANIIQAVIILPAILKYKGLSPLKLFKSVHPALTTAFFAKSSSAALPLSMDCMIENHKTPEDLTRFSLPICTIINMNGCAAFIYTTVLFVALHAGFSFSAIDYVLWIFIATIVAIGNASVPMGCYFLSSAILVGMGAPLTMMGIILPLYTFIDMVETALNVWSDCCVTDMVANDSKELI